jgi:hypothetical protein
VSITGQQAIELRSLAERLNSTSEQSRSTFTDESRPKFDQRVIRAMRSEIRSLAVKVSKLDAALERALCILD